MDKSCLLIRDGNTHHPAERRERRFFRGALDLPPRIVVVDGSGELTLDALAWLAEQRIPLIRLSYDGRVQSLYSASGYAADPKTVALQQKIRTSQSSRVRHAVPLIVKKTQETLYNLRHVLPDGPSRAKAIETASEALRDLRRSPPTSIPKLLAIEGRVAQGYFFAWRALQMRWKSTSRYPIPDEWRRFFSRSSLTRVSNTPQNMHATHPINAMLNYAYGMLEGSVRINVIANGYDPTVGVMHDTGRSERHSFIFDQMEPMRPIVDRAVLKLIAEEAFSGADFILQSDGVCRLNPELCRRVVELCSTHLATATHSL